MVLSNCKFLSNLVFKSHSIIIRMDDTVFLATWGGTGNVGVVYLTKAELKKLVTSTTFDNGEYITSMLPNIVFIGIVRTVRSQTRNTNGNRRSCVQIETEV